jgi:hypothetical protein
MTSELGNTPLPEKPASQRPSRALSPRVVHTLVGPIAAEGATSSTVVSGVQIESEVNVETVPVQVGLEVMGWPYVKERPVHPETMEDLAYCALIDSIATLFDECQRTSPSLVARHMPVMTTKQLTQPMRANNYAKLCKNMDTSNFNGRIQKALLLLTERAPDDAAAFSSSMLNLCAIAYDFQMQGYLKVEARVNEAHKTLVQCYNDAVFRQNRLESSGAGNQLRDLDYVHRWAQMTEGAEMQVRAAALADGDSRLAATIAALDTWSQSAQSVESAEALLALSDNEFLEIERCGQAFSYAGAIINFDALYTTALLHRREAFQRCILAGLWSMTGHNHSKNHDDSSTLGGIAEGWSGSASMVPPELSTLRLIGSTSSMDTFLGFAAAFATELPFLNDPEGIAAELGAVFNALQEFLAVTRDEGFSWAEQALATGKFTMPPSISTMNATRRSLARVEQKRTVILIVDVNEKQLVDLLFSALEGAAKEVSNLIDQTVDIIRKQESQQRMHKFVWDHVPDEYVALNPTPIRIESEDSLDAAGGKRSPLENFKRITRRLLSSHAKPELLAQCGRIEAFSLPHLLTDRRISKKRLVSMSRKTGMGSTATFLGTKSAKRRKMLQVPLHASLASSAENTVGAQQTLREDAVDLALKQIAFFSSAGETDILHNPSVAIGDVAMVVNRRMKRNLGLCGIHCHSLDHGSAVKAFQDISERISKVRESPKRNVQRNKMEGEILRMTEDMKERVETMLELAIELTIYRMLSEKDPLVSDPTNVVEQAYALLERKYGIDILEKKFSTKLIAQSLIKKVSRSSLNHANIGRQSAFLNEALYMHAAVAESPSCCVGAVLCCDEHLTRVFVKYSIWLAESSNLDNFGTRVVSFGLPDGTDIGSYLIDLRPENEDTISRGNGGPVVEPSRASMQARELRLTLECDDKQLQDLNLHCWTSEGVHCFSGNKCECAVDGIEFSENPQSITINVRETVDYHIFVHDAMISPSRANDNLDISNSGAQVTMSGLELSGGQPTLACPRNHNGAHDLWACFEIVADSLIVHNELMLRFSDGFRSLWPNAAASLEDPLNSVVEETYRQEKRDAIEQRRTALEAEAAKLREAEEARLLAQQVAASIAETEATKRAEEEALIATFDVLVAEVGAEVSSSAFEEATDEEAQKAFLADQERRRLRRERKKKEENAKVVAQTTVIPEQDTAQKEPAAERGEEGERGETRHTLEEEGIPEQIVTEVTESGAAAAAVAAASEEATSNTMGTAANIVTDNEVDGGRSQDRSFENDGSMCHDAPYLEVAQVTIDSVVKSAIMLPAVAAGIIVERDHQTLSSATREAASEAVVTTAEEAFDISNTRGTMASSSSTRRGERLPNGEWALIRQDENGSVLEVFNASKGSVTGATKSEASGDL